MTSQVYRVLLIANRERDRHLVDNLCNSVSNYQLELDWIAERQTIDWDIISDRYDLYLIDFACFRVESFPKLFPAIALIDKPEQIRTVLDWCS